MNLDIFSCVFTMLTVFLTDFCICLLRRRYAKKSNYDCSSCKAWDCDAKTCILRRAEALKEVSK